MLQIAPHRYQSARGALQQLGEHLENIGERALVIGNKTALERFEDVIRSSLKDSMIGVSFEICLGQCCIPEIERLVDEAKDEEADMIIGIGAGKTLDVAKMVGHRIGSKIITIPTVASSCAAYTNLVYLHNEDGEFIKQEILETCPDLVVVDYKIVGLAPSRYLSAGMGAAYSSWYEFNLSREELQLNQPRRIAFELASHMQEVLLDKGRKALKDVKRGEVTSPVEAIIEINILQAGLVRCLSGSRFRTMVAYQLAQELLPYCGKEILFGGVVAFGVITQELLRGTRPENMKELLDFYRDINLPLSLDSLELPENQRDAILADAVSRVVQQLEGRNLPFEVEEESLLDAIKETDQIGQRVIQSGVESVS